MAAETDITTTPTERDLTRRGVLRGAAVGGLVVPALAACGGGDEPTTAANDGDPGGALASTADVPLDGGTVIADDKVVLTQPAKDDFKAFTAVCTHQGCIVATVADGTINCNCHGSKYSIEDGSVVNGPATRPLAPIGIKVEGGEITRA